LQKDKEVIEKKRERGKINAQRSIEKCAPIKEHRKKTYMKHDPLQK
jgi:hypothetical protein